MEDENKGFTVGAGLYYSTEYDYQSLGGNLSFSKKTRDRNGELIAKLQTYQDQISAIYPIELRPSLSSAAANMKRKTYSASLSWSQVVNKSLQLILEAEFVYQKGFLGLPFNRVYFADNSVHVEQLPSTRVKIPVGIRVNYFMGDRLIIRGWYRFYEDSWGILSNTMQMETSVKVNPFFSITPFYRFYQQTAADYFDSYKIHTTADNYYTSNYDLSRFISHFFGLGFRVAPPGGVLHLQRLNALEMRYGHYSKNIDMNANIISLHIKFK